MKEVTCEWLYLMLPLCEVHERENCTRRKDESYQRLLKLGRKKWTRAGSSSMKTSAGKWQVRVTSSVWTYRICHTRGNANLWLNCMSCMKNNFSTVTTVLPWWRNRHPWQIWNCVAQRNVYAFFFVFFQLKVEFNELKVKKNYLLGTD